MVATTIERVYGRQRLVACIANPLQQFATFNRAVKIHNQEYGTSLPTWSPEIIAALLRMEDGNDFID